MGLAFRFHVVNHLKFGGGKEMKKVICSMLIVISVFVYGFAMAAAGGGGSTAQVTVVNTPLPVTGNVGISNSESNPVPVKGNINVSDPATRAVTYNMKKLCGGTSSCQCKFADVPAGKRLVIETIYAWVGNFDTNWSETIGTWINTTLNDKTIRVAIPDGTLMSTRLYADHADETPKFEAYLADISDSLLIDITVSGYLVDIP